MFDPYKNFDREIETGHVYANLAIALSLSKDPQESLEISETMGELVSKSRYLQSLLESYGPYRIADALTFLANRACRNQWKSVVVLDGNLQDQQTSGMSYGFREELV